MTSPFPYSHLPYAIAARAPKGEWQPTPPTPALIQWRDGQPHSLHFDDCYFSCHGGLEESRYVFLEGTQLSDLFEENGAEQSGVCVAELGFGTGLNFLATLSLWQKRKVKSPSWAARLNYLAFERYPLTQADLVRAHALFPELGELSELLQQHYPPCVAGMHYLEFPDLQSSLTLVWGEISEFIPLLQARIDAWFLDGFSPAKNEAMWQPEIFQEIARLSNPGARLASFSSARVLKDGLSSVGFSVQKLPGFAGKREMTTARYAVESSRNPAPSTLRVAPTIPLRVSVVGAGIVGASLAWALSKRGYQVQVIDSQPEIAAEASGNPAAVLMPYLSVKPDFLSRFYLSGFLYTLRCLAQLPDREEIFAACGVVRMATSGRLERLLETLDAQGLPEGIARVVDQREASQLCGVAVDAGALPKAGFWHATGGLIRPRKLAAALLRQPGITFLSSTQVTEMSQQGAHWLLRTQDSKRIESDVVVLANAYRVGEFAQTSWLPLEPVKGQLAYLQAHPQLRGLQAVLCYEGYLLPALATKEMTEEMTAEMQVLGASYEHDAESLALEATVAQQLVERLAERVQGLDPQSVKVVDGRASYRTMSADRMPIVGALPDTSCFEAAYLEANAGKFGECYPSAGRYSNAYLSIGHGSRGLASCLLSAEIVATMVDAGGSAGASIMPLESDLLRAIDPARFLVRAIKRGVALDAES